MKHESRRRLLDTAERLLAEHGLAGVSLRQIGAEAGEGNNSVIQYHFGDKAGLIREIIARRVESFEPRREVLLSEATARAREPQMIDLLKVLFLPLAEAKDAYGRHPYARFMVQFVMQFQHQDGVRHPGWSPDSAAGRAAALLGEQLPFLSTRALSDRISWLSIFFLGALVERDNARARGKPVQRDSLFLDNIFAMMSAAIRAEP
jgi:AcrR family transcriptional regulator